MQLSRVGEGRTGFIMPVAVFSTTVIVEGALLVSGASTTAQGATVTVALDTSDGNNFIGVTQVSSSLAVQNKENLGPNSHAYQIATSGIPNRNTVSGLNYLPLCINTDAMYYALYSTTTGAGTASDTVGTWTASSTTAAVRGTTGVDVLGGWLFSLGGVNSAGNTPTFSGSLRYIANQAATTSLTLLTAMNISTDSHMIWADRTWKKSIVLNSTADKIRSQSGSSGTGLHLNGARAIRVDNYIKHDNAPMHPLRQWVDDGSNGLTGVSVWGEFIFTSPFIQDQA